MSPVVTFDVEPGTVNYVGHFGATYQNGRLVGYVAADRFAALESTIRDGFGDSEIANKASHY